MKYSQYSSCIWVAAIMFISFVTLSFIVIILYNNIHVNLNCETAAF